MLTRAITNIAFEYNARLQSGTAANAADQSEVSQTIQIAVDRHLADRKKLRELLDGRCLARAQKLKNTTTPRLSH